MSVKMLPLPTKLNFPRAGPGHRRPSPQGAKLETPRGGVGNSQRSTEARMDNIVFGVGVCCGPDREVEFRGGVAGRPLTKTKLFSIGP